KAARQKIYFRPGVSRRQTVGQTGDVESAIEDRREEAAGQVDLYAADQATDQRHRAGEDGAGSHHVSSQGQSRPGPGERARQAGGTQAPTGEADEAEHA